MLKRGLVLAALALAGFTVPGQASALTITGTLQMHQTVTVSCNVQLNAVVAPSGLTAVITGGSFSPGDWQCGWLVTPSAFPWSVTITGPSSVTVSGVGATTILGSCSGSFSSNGLTPTSLVISPLTPAVLPGTPGACTFSGVLNF
ncbi:hypothetical protein AS593_00165 [Caulobacter vibrioides]|nr:hypothetical protein AS593_00165 [Caulobacter vibrioides]